MNEQSGKRKAASGKQSPRSRCARTSLRFPPAAFRLRSGVTLIELLITVTIVAILSATFLGVSNLAMESARAARTKTTISKIHGLLMEKWNSYATRRVDVNGAIVSAINTSGLDSRLRGQMLQDVRLLALRELMMLEMPDSWSDIILDPVGDTPLTSPRMLNAFPALRETYLRRYDQVVVKTPPGVDDNTERIIANQGAECLYLIVMLATGDGEARTLFNDQDIGDTDEDGALEFLDGWGRPIQFIRWPAGFAARSDLMSGNTDSDGDPFDVFRRDQLNAPRPVQAAYSSTLSPLISAWVDELRDDNPAYRLLPLIYSAGADGETDIDEFPYTGSDGPSSLDPYGIDPDDPGLVFVPFDVNFVFGFPSDNNNDGDDNSLDNIHNHLQDNR